MKQTSTKHTHLHGIDPSGMICSTSVWTRAIQRLQPGCRALFVVLKKCRNIVSSPFEVVSLFLSPSKVHHRSAFIIPSKNDSVPQAPFP
jgi:hypothetical protein